MIKPFQTVKEAALGLINSGAPLRSKEGQFLGGIAFSNDPLSEKQEHWLQVLLEKHGLPSLDLGGTYG